MQYDQISASPETESERHMEGITSKKKRWNSKFRNTENRKAENATITTQPLVINQNLIQNLSIRTIQ
ncbi:hypothetical protein J2T58_001931 [Methanocalculus alkaliphilus]|nr:hypothetical protein [Methanocalculus alkaliphilus]